jgi:tubulin-specific chaperone A
MSTAADTKRLKIQISCCKRMQKEVDSYKKEVVTNEARVQKMRDDGKDIYDIRYYIKFI